MNVDKINPMRRRRLMTATLAAAFCARGWGARAQQRGREFRIGLLNGNSAEINEALFAALRDGLGARGYIVGRNLIYDAAYAESRPERLSSLARALVERRPDVIVTYSTETTRAVAEVTSTIPIVMTNGNDPVTSGFTATLARPSRNVTGFLNFSEVVEAKRLDYLIQLAPGIRRVGLLYGSLSGALLREATEPLARAREIALVPMVVTESAGVVPALVAAMAPPLGAMTVNAEPIV
jgi:putative ABC transport system substrate-binding protein